MSTTTHPASMTTEQRDKARRAFIAGDITDVIRGENKAFAIFHYTNPSGALCALAFAGKAIKPAFRYRFRSAKLREQHCNEWAGRVMLAAATTTERRVARNQAHTLAIGDVLISMWGYEQTNVDYYEVIELHGRTQVTLRQIARRTEVTGDMQGDCAPVPGQFIGEPSRRRVDGAHNAVRFSSFERASKVEPLATVDGVRIWPVEHWTAYA